MAFKIKMDGLAVPASKRARYLSETPESSASLRLDIDFLIRSVRTRSPSIVRYPEVGSVLSCRRGLFILQNNTLL